MQISITEMQLQKLKNVYRANKFGGHSYVNENIETEVNADDIDLTSFEIQSNLATKIWDGMELNSRVRLQLLDIADDFIDFLNLDWVKPKDIVLTGSICNYNWSEYSDIDIHIIYDFTEIDENTDLIRSYVDAKKNEWLENHDNLKIYGFDVELYVEDSNESAISSGVYSLEKNEWVKEPSKEDMELHSTSEIKSLSAEIMTLIDDMETCYSAAMTDSDLENLQEQLNSLIDVIKNMRKRELSIGGEMAVGNIVFKTLRREGYMDKLYELNNDIYDILNSL